MLIIELDLARITASQGGYRERGTMKGAELARQVRSMRIALTALIDRFHRRQEQAAKRGDPVLEDGTQATLMDQVLNPAGANAWPRRAAAILHGLHLPVAPLLPAVPCRPRGRRLARPGRGNLPDPPRRRPPRGPASGVHHRPGALHGAVEDAPHSLDRRRGRRRRRRPRSRGRDRQLDRLDRRQRALRAVAGPGMPAPFRRAVLTSPASRCLIRQRNRTPSRSGR